MDGPCGVSFYSTINRKSRWNSEYHGHYVSSPSQLWLVLATRWFSSCNYGHIKSISMSAYSILDCISSFSYCKIATYQPILTFLVSFKRRDLDDSDDGKINDFASIHAKFQSNWKNMSFMIVSSCFSTFQLLFLHGIKGNMKGNTSVKEIKLAYTTSV